MALMWTAVVFLSSVFFAQCAPQCSLGDRSSTCAQKSGARTGGAMIQKPADGSAIAPATKLSLLQTPLQTKLQHLETDVAGLTDRVQKLQAKVGIESPPPAALQAVAEVGQFPKFSVPSGPDAASNPSAVQQGAVVSADKSANAAQSSQVRQPEQIQQNPMVRQPEQSQQNPLVGQSHDAKQAEIAHRNPQLERFDAIISKIKHTQVLMQVNNSDNDDATLKAMIEDLEVKVADLKSKVLDLENMVAGSNSVWPVTQKITGNETTALASRAGTLDLEVAQLRTRVASLEQMVTGDQVSVAAAS